ncbi:hypothetical protein GBAR_LOCUS20919, partial [Geodia barretti]
MNYFSNSHIPTLIHIIKAVSYITLYKCVPSYALFSNKCNSPINSLFRGSTVYYRHWKLKLVGYHVITRCNNNIVRCDNLRLPQA